MGEEVQSREKKGGGEGKDFLREKLLEKARSLSTRPGCYLMKSSMGKILYVGKAKSLRSRVSSYFQNSAKSPKTEILVGHICDFDFALTETESEALILENNLIKKYRPKYNILMRDDKTYPYVSVDLSKPFPRPTYKRRIKRGKEHKIYGPFVHGSGISDVLRILIKSFQLRDCSLREFRSRKEPCLLYQIKQCSAPCVGLIGEEEYQRDLEMALRFFEFNSEEALSLLERRMREAADREEFEYAAMIRDNLDVLTHFMEFSKGGEYGALLEGLKDVDILAYNVGEIEVEISLSLIRNGLFLGHKNFHFPLVDCQVNSKGNYKENDKENHQEDVENEIINFLFQYYTSGENPLPELAVVDLKKEKRELFAQAISTCAKGLKVWDGHSEMGKYDFSSLLNLTRENAREHQRVRYENADSPFIGLNKLKELLGLKERPIVLECYDIALFQGTSPTAAQIVFREGRPEPREYRHYHLREREEGNNDFEMMKEVLSRRMDNGNLPDVFIVDGGKGQLSILQGVLKDFNLNIPVCALAKSKVKGNFRDKEIERSEERLFIPLRKNPFLLHKNRSLFKIITQMRDEAHRFSRKLHHKEEKKRVFSSWIDRVEGVGPKTKKKILEKLELNRQELRVKSPKEISLLLGVSLKVAQNILKAISD